MTHPAIAQCLAGSISPAVALARLVLDGIDPERIATMLPATGALPDLFAQQRTNLVKLAAVLRDSGTNHAPLSGAAGIAAVSAMFDRAVAASPEASVAAYSLGDGTLLAAATAEIVDWLAIGGELDGALDVLDFGCGFGRVAAAMAPRVRSVLAVDVSAGMIAEAQRRYRHPNLSFAESDGGPLLALNPASFDLILAVDSMPYLVQVGMAREHLAAWRPLLRAGGRIVILNLSYRGYPALDRSDLFDWAQTFGLTVEICGERPFRSWDGAAFVLRVAT